MKRHKNGSRKKKDNSSKSDDYEDIDRAQDDEGSSCKIHQIPVIRSGIQASVDKSTDGMHMYDVVTQPIEGHAGSSDQQHIYSRTQHGSIKQQTHSECRQRNTNGHEYERLDGTKTGQKRVEGHKYDQVLPGEQQTQLGSGDQEHLYHVLEGPAEVHNSADNATTTEDMYSTPNFESSSTGQPQTQKTFLEGPFASTATYSSPQMSTNSGKEDDKEPDYDEPIHPNWPTAKPEDEVDQNREPEVLFDDPSYQATVSAQPHALSQNLSYNTKDNTPPSSSEAIPVEDQGKLPTDPACQVSTAVGPARRLTASSSNQDLKKGKEGDTSMHDRDLTISPSTPKGEYDQPTVIAATSKDASRPEGDQSILFDDPIYSQQI